MTASDLLPAIDFAAGPLLVTGSIATDQLMTFHGRFADSFVAEQLDKVSLSFLVDDLQVRRGGCAANIAFGYASLGGHPVVVGAVGDDFADYRSWLESHGVDCRGIRVSTSRKTARFVCTTDDSQAQIASFYGGAMVEARDIDLADVAAAVGRPALVLVGPDDPVAMVRHTRRCRELGLPFAADPSQQLTTLGGDDLRELVDGAAFLFGNLYEAGLLHTRTGWTAEQVLDRVGCRVTTQGPDGALLQVRGRPAVAVPAVPPHGELEPTGVGDAFRAGFLAGLSWQLPAAQVAQVGCLLAVLVLETAGTQEYVVDLDAFLARFADTYGSAAAAVVRPHLPAVAVR